LKFTRFAC